MKSVARKNNEGFGKAQQIARKFFKGRLRKGVLVAVDLESGECICETDADKDALLQLRGRRPAGDLRFIRYGCKAAFKIHNPYWAPMV